MSLSKQLAITTVTYGPCTLDDALGSIRGAGYSRVEVVCVPGHCDHYEIDMDDAHRIDLACRGNGRVARRRSSTRRATARSRS